MGYEVLGRVREEPLGSECSACEEGGFIVEWGGWPFEGGDVCGAPGS